LTHIDFSEDGSLLVVNTQDYWLKFFNVQAATDASASSCKDVKWFTWTCTLGFYSQGIFPHAEGNDVNTVCRSNNQKFLVTGDDYGKVNLFAFPCVVAKAQCIPFAGHSSHVTKVKFSFGKGSKGASKEEEKPEENNAEEEGNDEVNPDAEDVVKVKEKKQGHHKFSKTLKSLKFL